MKENESKKKTPDHAFVFLYLSLMKSRFWTENDFWNERESRKPPKQNHCGCTFFLFCLLNHTNPVCPCLVYFVLLLCLLLFSLVHLCPTNHVVERSERKNPLLLPTQHKTRSCRATPNRVTLPEAVKAGHGSTVFLLSLLCLAYCFALACSARKGREGKE